MSDLINVAAFKGMVPATAFAGLDPTTENLSDGIGSSYGIVGYKGKVWTLRLRGETKQFLRPDDGTAAPFLNVIILRQLPTKSKSFYPPGTYQDGQIGTRPVCSSLDSVSPDADVATPQARACAICPRNVFKLNAEGRKTRECSDYKRLAVLILPSQTKQMFGAPLMEPVFLRVPAASLNELATLGEQMSQMGFHFSTYITQIGFIMDKPHPQMTFKAIQGLTNAEAPMVMPMREDAMALRITGEADMSKPRAAPVAVAENVIPIRETVVVQAPVQPAPVQPVALDTGFVTVAVAPVAVAPVVQAQVQPMTLDTGFGSVGEVQQPVAVHAQTTTVNTVADTGAPEDADDDLDARVAALLPKS